MNTICINTFKENTIIRWKSRYNLSMEHEDVKNPFLFFLIKIWGKNAQNNTIAFYIGYHVSKGLCRWHNILEGQSYWSCRLIWLLCFNVLKKLCLETFEP